MSLVDRLQAVVHGWTSARRGRTLKQLSEETQLNYGTVKNISDGKSEPNGETVLRLLLPILPIHEVHEIIAAYFPHMAPYSKALSEMSVMVSTVSDLTPKHNRAILELSFGPLDESTLAILLGTGWQTIINDLTEAEICRKTSDGVVLRGGSIHFPRQQYAHDVLSHFLSHVNISVPGNKLVVHSKAMNEEGLRRAYEVIMKAEAELQSLMADPALRGDRKFGSALLTTIL
jgi:hypothetical protein